MNREAVDALTLGAADGMQAMGVRIVEAANPPDAAPWGKGLVGGGTAITMVDRKKVAGYGPLRVGRSQRPPAVGVVTFVGWSFPGRLQELGTAHHPAQPFLTPSFQQEVPEVADEVANAIEARLKRIRNRPA